MQTVNVWSLIRLRPISRTPTIITPVHVSQIGRWCMCKGYNMHLHVRHSCVQSTASTSQRGPNNVPDSRNSPRPQESGMDLQCQNVRAANLCQSTSIVAEAWSTNLQSVQQHRQLKGSKSMAHDDISIQASQAGKKTAQQLPLTDTHTHAHTHTHTCRKRGTAEGEERYIE